MTDPISASETQKPVIDLRERIAQAVYSANPDMAGSSVDGYTSAITWSEASNPGKKLRYRIADAVLAVIRPEIERLGTIADIKSMPLGDYEEWIVAKATVMLQANLAFAEQQRTELRQRLSYLVFYLRRDNPDLSVLCAQAALGAEEYLESNKP